MVEKKPRILYWEGRLESFIPVPSLESLIDSEENNFGDEVVFMFKRINMTDEEFQALGG